MSLTETIAAIQAGPKGPQIGAFFDFDGTLIDGFSALAYFTDKLRRRQLGLREAADIIRVALRRDMNEREFDAFFAKNVAGWAGHPENELIELWSRLFKDTIAGWTFPGSVGPREGASENGAHRSDRILGDALPNRSHCRGVGN